MTEMEVRNRRNQHQARMRQGSLVESDRKLTEVEVEADKVKRRKREHQNKLRGSS